MRLRADRSVYATVAKFIQDEHLRQAFSFHPLLVGGNPFDTSSIYTLIHWIEREWGVFFPAGGTGALVRGLVRLFQEMGGKLELNCPVQSVHVQDSHGRDNPHGVKHLLKANGREAERFDIVVSNADVHHTYAKIYQSHPLSSRRRRKLEKMQWSMSLFVMYFGTNRRYDIAHHTILFGQRFKGLIRDIFRGDSLPEDFSLYLHAPTVTDTSLAPPGCEAFYVLSPVPHLGQAAVDWQTACEVYGDRILESLEKYLPGLRKSIVTRRHFTPEDFRTQLNAYQGSAFSVAPKLTQSISFGRTIATPGFPGCISLARVLIPARACPGLSTPPRRRLQ